MMNKKDLHIELLDRFMKGDTSPEEENILLEWFRDVRSKDELFSFYTRKWEETYGKELSAEVQGRMYHQLKDKMRAIERKEGNAEKLSRGKFWEGWRSYAAVILLCVSLSIGSYLYNMEWNEIHKPMSCQRIEDSAQV